MIEVKNVEKLYGKRKAIDDINITLRKGKIYGILGPNGSGKSTLLKMMAGLVYPSTGEVLVDGQKVERNIAGKLSYLATEGMLYPKFTILQMIDYFASQFPDFSVEKAEQLLSFMSLDKEQKVSKLSKGQQGRLKLLLVLSRSTPYLLLDEPFLGLDPMVRDTIVKGLVSFIDFGEQTVIITTHEVTEIEPILEEAIILEAGKVRATCNVEQLREEEGVSVLRWLKNNVNREDT